MTKRLLVALVSAMLTCGALAGGASAATPWTFAVISDTQAYGSDNTNGVSVATMTPIVNHLATVEQPDLVLVSGDLVEGYADDAGMTLQLTTWRNTMQPVYDAGIPVYPIRGGHDIGYATDAKGVWNTVFSGSYDLPSNGPTGEEGVTYSFQHNNAFFMGIDICEPYPHVTQSWVDAQLASNSQPHVFAYAHEQVVHVEHDYSLDNVPAIRDPFVASLINADSRTYFCGHMHCHNITRLNDDVADPTDSNAIDDFYQVIVPPGGAKTYGWDGLYDGNPIPGRTPHLVSHMQGTDIHGYTLVTIDGLDVTIQFVKNMGGGTFTAVDTFSYTQIPEPATMGLLAFGMLGVLVRRRRR